jgi:hypothetical protein
MVHLMVTNVCALCFSAKFSVWAATAEFKTKERQSLSVQNSNSQKDGTLKYGIHSLGCDAVKFDRLVSYLTSMHNIEFQFSTLKMQAVGSS